MTNRCLAQPLRHLHPDAEEFPQCSRAVEILLDKLVETDSAFDPMHLEGRIPLAADSNSSIQVLEVDHEGQTGTFQVIRDMLVSLCLAGNLFREAL